MPTPTEKAVAAFIKDVADQDYKKAHNSLQNAIESKLKDSITATAATKNNTIGDK